MDTTFDPVSNSQIIFEDVPLKGQDESPPTEQDAISLLPLDEETSDCRADDYKDSNSVKASDCIQEFNVEDPLLDEQSKEVLLSLLRKTVNEKKYLEDACKTWQNEAQVTATQSKSHIEDLVDQLAQAKVDISTLKGEYQFGTDKIIKEAKVVKEDLTSKLANLQKQYEAANRDKEDMVVKYAMGEKEVIIVKRQKENVEKKVRELERDKDILQGKIKSLSAERSRICSTLDNKIQENGVATRTIDKLREEINSKDIKIKWSQSRLLNEIDAHKETLIKMDKALYMITNHEEEIRVVREEAEKMVRETKQAERTRENILEKQLQETKAKLIMETQKHEDLSRLYKQLKTEFEKLMSSHFNNMIGTTSEDNTSKCDADKTEFDMGNSEQITELSELLKNSIACASQLEKEKLRANTAERTMIELQNKVEEQHLEIDNCRMKEAELLSFTQKLTDKNVILQSQLTTIQGKTRLFELEHGEIKSELVELQSLNMELQKEFNSVSAAKIVNEQKLKAFLEERNEEVNVLKTKVSDLLNEIEVLKKKHTNYSKDSSREILKLRKKLDALEHQNSVIDTDKPSPNNFSNEHVSESISNGLKSDKNSTLPTVLQEYLSQDSRTSSDTSLNTLESNSTAAYVGNLPQRSTAEASSIDDLPQHVLIARIIKLQKNIVKKSEKLEFLEEHVQQLLMELKKKNKIINHYILNEETGILSNAKSDSTKAAIMKHGGIMASVYGSTLKDETMTLDLSLEINRKLQGVLEDTLLKNITLKENLNTLGDEVAKLTIQNSHSSGKS